MTTRQPLGCVKSPTVTRLTSLGLLLLSWSLLLWINFAIPPNAFAHFVAIPSLLIASGVSSVLMLCHKPNTDQ